MLKILTFYYIDESFVINVEIHCILKIWYAYIFISADCRHRPSKRYGKLQYYSIKGNGNNTRLAILSSIGVWIKKPNSVFTTLAQWK